MQWLIVLLILSNFVLANEAKASDADCSIWLCLPMGFGEGCDDAKKAFKDRIKNFKPPLPDLMSCLVSGDMKPVLDSDVDSKEGIAALIPARTIKGKYIPTHTVKDVRCHYYSNFRKPAGCSTTIRYVDTYIDGGKYGGTFYFDNNGDAINTP